MIELDIGILLKNFSNKIFSWNVLKLKNVNLVENSSAIVIK